MGARRPWRRDAPVVFVRARPFEPQQGDFLTTAAPRGSTEHEVLDEYVNGGESLWFNNYLRGIGMASLSERQRAALRRKTTVLNELIRRAPRSRREMVLFRAVAEDAPRFQSYRRGDDADFLNRGIVSTSVSYDAATSFLEKDETCCLLVLLVPSGTRLLEVLDRSAWSEESEVLLPHGCRFAIEATRVIDGIATYYCVLVAQRDTQKHGHPKVITEPHRSARS